MHAIRPLGPSDSDEQTKKKHNRKYWTQNKLMKLLLLYCYFSSLATMSMYARVSLCIDIMVVEENKNRNQPADMLQSIYIGCMKGQQLFQCVIPNDHQREAAKPAA